ncbi:DUF4157 domain-containing protein [Sphingopyxis sp. KK2]|uniref:eCIS core domain-containing protein n=1 Tax=Sphingopyxis sp. KK2 TaxID=1855727 RepID=UPI00097E5F4B|nr:DUF4157 domain-containing protein [Sphingopyxis sp. KK2]
MYRHAIRRKCRTNSAATPPQQAPMRALNSPLWSLANIPARPGQGVRVQPKLMIGAANDSAEQAADRAAERVMRMGEHDAPVAAGAAPVGQVQRKCAACEDEAGTIQREALGGAAGGAASPAARSAIGAMGGGSPLPASERAFFEPRFGRDLSGVRVHDGVAADAASQSIAARAFTLGNDIAFARGEYRPGTGEGRRLMAHELAHVMQQGGDVVHRKPTETKAPPKNGDMAVAMTAAGAGVSGTIKFTPTAQCPKCNTIRLVQVVRVFEKPGEDYKWAGGEKNREKVKTTEDTTKGIKGNFFVDHFAAKCTEGTACSIYYRDHAPNASKSQDGSYDGTTAKAASLWDGPSGDANDIFEFETCARCAETGAYLGCIDWGFAVDAAGKATLSATSEHLQPSATFAAAVATFNKFYKNP